jgi:predicted metal-dependent peptidase
MAGNTAIVKPTQDNIDAFQLARLWAVQKCPYFSEILYAVQPVFVEGLDTFAVDKHGRLYLDVDALTTTWNQEEAGSVLIHEVGHVLRSHGDRLTAPGIDHEIANVAMDMEINDDLDFLPLPSPVHPRDADFPVGLLGEEYYNLLTEQSQSQSSSKMSNGAGSPSEMSDNPGSPSGSGSEPGDQGDGGDRKQPTCGSGAGGTPLECELAASDTRAISLSELQQASLRIRVANNIQALPPGTVSGDWEEWSKQLVKPTVNWKRVLRGRASRMVDHMTQHSENTWNRPNSRSTSIKPFIFPGEIYNDTTVAIVLDTSASMDSDHALDSALSELQGLFKQREVKTSVVCCDAEVSQVRNISSLSELGQRRSGGTDMRVGIDMALDLHPKPSMVVVLTDGGTLWPDTKITTPILACLVGSNPPVDDVPSCIQTVVVYIPKPTPSVKSTHAPTMTF